MSVDTAWTAQSLQAPVHNHLSKVSRQMDQMFGGTNVTNQVLNAARVNTRLPIQGPQAAIARNALEQRILGSQQGTGVFATATPAPSAGIQTSHSGTSTLDLISQQAAKQAAKQAATTNVVQPIAAPSMPGIDPAIATAVPGAPSTGIPQMPQISGWTSPGRNFTISQVQ
jgi:hypothetical protein